MKKLISAILILISTFCSADESLQLRGSYDQLLLRVKSVDQFLPKYKKIKENAEFAHGRVSAFEHPNMLKLEEVELENMRKLTQSTLTELGDPTSKLFTGQIHKELEDVYKKIQEREKFLKHEQMMKSIEKRATAGQVEFSKRFEKFIQLQKNGKDVQADLLFRLLPKAEKQLALTYKESRIYTLQQSGVQSYLLSSIKTEMEKISFKILYPEKTIQQAKSSEASIKKLTKNLDEIEEQLNLVQYDLQFRESWQVGSFGCRETNPREYYTFDHFPGWILLKNEEGSAIVKVNQSQPSSFEILYRCERSGSFGFCLDNEMKQYCKLDPECLSLQSNLEGQFNPAVEFKNNFVALTTKYAEETYEDVFSKLLPVYDSVSHYWTHQDFRGFADKIEAERVGIIATTPAEYKRKFKLILAKYEKEIDRDLKRKPGYEETSELARISKNLARHFILTLEGHTDTVAQNDKIEEFSASQCSLQANIQSTFCQAHSLWSQRIKVFSEPRPLKNLAPLEECPRAVFRVNPSSGQWSQKSCGPDVPPVSRTISPLDRDVRTILRSIK